jgi:hypothetical protein
MMAVLPGRRRKNQSRLGIDPQEDIHAGALRGDEPVLELFVVGMRPHQLDPLLGKGSSQRLFHGALCRPASLVGGKPKVPAGHQQNFIRRRFGDLICTRGHAFPSSSGSLAVSFSDPAAGLLPRKNIHRPPARGARWR